MDVLKIASSPYFLNNYIEILSSILGRIVKSNDASPGCDKVVTQFHSETAPSVAIRDYMERILKLTKCEPGSIVLAVFYMLRICRDHSIPLTSLCFHRLFITSVCVSMKYFEDDVYSNKYMAKVGGISTRELSVLERLHLVMLKFSLMITPSDYGSFCKEAVRLEGQILLDSVPSKGKKKDSSFNNALSLIHRLLPSPPKSEDSDKDKDKEKEKGSSDKNAEKSSEKGAEKSAEKPAEKSAEKPAEKSAEKPAEKSAEKPAEKSDEKRNEKVNEKDNSEKSSEKSQSNEKLAEKKPDAVEEQQSSSSVKEDQKSNEKPADEKPAAAEEQQQSSVKEDAKEEEEKKKSPEKSPEKSPSSKGSEESAASGSAVD